MEGDPWTVTILVIFILLKWDRSDLLEFTLKGEVNCSPRPLNGTALQRHFTIKRCVLNKCNAMQLVAIHSFLAPLDCIIKTKICTKCVSVWSALLLYLYSICIYNASQCRSVHHNVWPSLLCGGLGGSIIKHFVSQYVFYSAGNCGIYLYDACNPPYNAVLWV